MGLILPSPLMRREWHIYQLLQKWWCWEDSNTDLQRTLRHPAGAVCVFAHKCVSTHISVSLYLFLSICLSRLYKIIHTGNPHIIYLLQGKGIPQQPQEKKKILVSSVENDWEDKDLEKKVWKDIFEIFLEGKKRICLVLNWKLFSTLEPHASTFISLPALGA